MASKVECAFAAARDAAEEFASAQVVAPHDGGDTPMNYANASARNHYGCSVAGWSDGVYCSADAQAVLKRLENAGWAFDGRRGENALVSCGCDDGHLGSIVLWPRLTSTLDDTVRLLERTTCLGE